MRIPQTLVGLAFATSLMACGPNQKVLTLAADPTAPAGTGATGVATLIDHGSSVEVVLKLTEGSDSGTQAAHIHSGQCGTLGAVTNPLNNVVGGQSDTTVNVTLASLQDGNHAINIHLSSDISKYVACANIK